MSIRSIFITVLISLVGGADLEAQLRTQVHASGFTSPIAFVQDPTDRERQLVVEQGGRIRVVHGTSVLARDFLDLTQVVSTGGERGLLGLAFAPDYVSSRRLFVNFTNQAGDTVVARVERSDDPTLADAASRFDLRWGGAGGAAVIPQPYANHNGGHLAFGPDGYLYIALGDGGSGNDPQHRAQNPAELLGKMLRIDVNVPDTHPTGYQVPADNPFVDGTPVAARPEIWSFGLRNPWRYSFDDPARGGTGGLFIGDVGQGQWEEIDYEPAGRGGRNYGWRNREGAHGHVTSLPPAYLPLTDPIVEYDHSTGQSIVGGYVYRGSALGSAYRGRYFFADFVAGRVWSIALTINSADGEARASDLVEHTAELGGFAQLGNISSFGIDADGELYLVSYSRGRILKIVGLAPVQSVSLASDKVAPQPPGTRITFTATPTGGVAPIQYKWWVFDGTTWRVEREWTSVNVFAWTPATPNPAYRVGVWAHSNGSTPGTFVYDWAEFAIQGTTEVRLAADRTAPQSPGTPITWTAEATGGGVPLQYKWWVFDGVTWRVLRDWTAANTFTWSPTLANPDYLVGVWVRSSGVSTDAPEAYASAPFAIHQVRVTAVTLTADRTAPQPPGTAITWTAMATGGAAPLQFKWWVFDGVTWRVLRDWTVDRVFVWTPTTANPGYLVGVWARSSGVTVDAPETYGSAPFAIAQARVTAVTLTADRMAPQPVGTPITWTAEATGGAAPLQYRWWVFDGVTWTMLRNWSTGNTFTWTAATTNSAYLVGVWVRSHGAATDSPEVYNSAPFPIQQPTMSSQP